MFEGCSSLTTAPELPATTLVGDCYSYMFEGCSSLTQAPELQATLLVDSCYQHMFKDCVSLRNIPSVPKLTANPPANCYDAMFNGCKSLKIKQDSGVESDKLILEIDESAVLDS